MRVTITRLREFQDAGDLRLLIVGEAYDLPDVVACALIATGAASRVLAAPERAVTGPREFKAQRRAS